MLDSIWNFITNNWLIIAPFILWLWSEILSLNPQWKTNGIIQLINAIVNKLLGKKSETV